MSSRSALVDHQSVVRSLAPSPTLEPDQEPCLPAATDKLFYRPREIQTATGLGRSEVYELIARGEFGEVIVKVGRATLIPTEAVRAWARRKMIEARSRCDVTSTLD